MLDWSEDKNHDITDTRMHAKFMEETTDETFELKITKLLKRAYANDLHIDKNAMSAYKVAHTALTEGDHYIGVMAESVFYDDLNAEEPEPVGKGKDQALLLVMGLSVFLMIPIYMYLKELPVFSTLGADSEHVLKAMTFMMWGHIPAIYFAHKKISKGYPELIVTSAIFFGAVSLLFTIFSHKLISCVGEEDFDLVPLLYFAGLFIIFSRRTCYTFLKLHLFPSSRSTKR